MLTSASAVARRSFFRAGPRRCQTTTAATTATAGSAPSPAVSQEWLRARPFEEMPGPKPLPVVGNVWRFLPPIGEFSKMDMGEVMGCMHDKFGKIVKVEGIPGAVPFVYLFDPAHVEKAFRNETSMPERHGLKSILHYRSVTRKELFDGARGILTTHGKEWQSFRRKVNQTMMQPRSAKLYVGAIDQVAGDFVDRMVELRNEKSEMPSDFINELYKWALESISLVALDARLGCLDKDLTADSEPQIMIDCVQDLFDAMFQLDVKPSLWKMTGMSTPTWRKLVRASDTFYDVANRYIAAAMDRIRARGEDATGELSVLEKLLLSNDDPRVASVMALDMMFAGVDTTSHATGTALYFLCKHPEIQERLYQELRSLLPESRSQPLTAEKLEASKYLKACVKESMRLRPIAQGNTRRVLVDHLVLGGYRIPKGSDLIMATAWLSNSEEQFPEASKFKPERWLKDSEGRFPAQSAHPFSFMPFGFGPRTCIGKRFAELEVHTLLARIIRRFRVEFDGEMRWKTGLLHCLDKPLTFRVFDREQ